MIRVRSIVEKNDSAVQRATAVFTEHGEFIRKVLRFQVGKKLDIEDLYQEFYLVLIHKPVPADVRDVRGYLYRAIVHYVIDAARSRAAYSHAVKKYAQETRISVNKQRTRNAFIDEEHRNAAVARLSRHLQKREAQVFTLKFRDGCSILEIATRMGITKRSVSRYLSASLRKLHRRLATE